MNERPEPAAKQTSVAAEDAVSQGGPRSSPQTDPTNPFHQESDGVFRTAEGAAERRVDEPGLTDADRVNRSV